jgi:hypothetical protein
MLKNQIFGVVLLGAMTTFAGAATRPIRNAYVPVPIHSVAQLENIVRTRPVVCDHYLRHFGMSKSELLIFFGSLAMSHATKPEETVMYSVPDSGIIKSHPYHVAKGEAVIVDQRGNLILCPKCGNPFTLGKRNTPNAAFEMPVLEEPVESGLKKLVEPTPASEVIGMLSEPMLQLDVPAIMADETEPQTSKDVIAAALAPAAEPQVQILAVAAAAGGGGFPLLPLLGAGGLAGALAGHGGGVPSAVPEPSALLLLAPIPLLFLRRKS